MSKNYKWLTKNNTQVYIHKDKCDAYLKDGWIFGISKSYKNKISNSLIGTHCGKCKDPEKELSRREKISLAMKGNTNWKFNKTRGNGKKGWYNNIFCDSTWELAFVVYHIEHNIDIKRCDLQLEYIWNNEKHIYNPDFIVNGQIIEIKGRKTKQSEAKHKQFPNIQVIDKDSIQIYLNYVTEKYGNNFWEKLYTTSVKQKQSISNKEEKIKKENNYRDILINLEQNSNIDFSKFGWVQKAKEYLNSRNELFYKNLDKFIKRYYPEFYINNEVFIRK